MNIMVETQAALEGAKSVIVLNAVSLKEPVLAIVHADWEVNHDLILWLSKNDLEVVREVHQIGSDKHAADRLAIEVVGISWESEFIKDRVLKLNATIATR